MVYHRSDTLLYACIHTYLGVDSPGHWTHARSKAGNVQHKRHNSKPRVVCGTVVLGPARIASVDAQCRSVVRKRVNIEQCIVETYETGEVSLLPARQAPDVPLTTPPTGSGQYPQLLCAIQSQQLSKAQVGSLPPSTVLRLTPKKKLMPSMTRHRVTPTKLHSRSGLRPEAQHIHECERGMK
jgi:hypothetical protein